MRWRLNQSATDCVVTPRLPACLYIVGSALVSGCCCCFFQRAGKGTPWPPSPLLPSTTWLTTLKKVYTLRSSKRQEAEDTVQLSQTRFLSTLFALEVNPPSRRHTTCSCSLPLQLKKEEEEEKEDLGKSEWTRKEGKRETMMDEEGPLSCDYVRHGINTHSTEAVRHRRRCICSVFELWGGLFYLMNTRRKGKEERSWWRFNASLLALVRAGAGKQGTRFACHSLNRLLRLRPTCVWVWK